MAESFNFVSTAAASKAIPPMKEPPPEKVAQVTLVESRDLEIVLDSAKGHSPGGWAPGSSVGDRPAPSKAGRPGSGRPGSPLPSARSERPPRPLSPRPTIGKGKEHRTGTPTRPTTGVLTPKKATVRRHLRVEDSDDDDGAPLVKHDASIHMKATSGRIRYTQEPVNSVGSSPPSPLPYLITGQRTATGYGKVLVPNPDYKEKGPTESASSNPAKVQRRRPPPKIHVPAGTMEFSEDDDEEEEKSQASDELVAGLKQKITALEEQIAELHIAVYDQQDEFSVLRKATTSKLKRFAKALGDPTLYDAEHP